MSPDTAAEPTTVLGWFARLGYQLFWSAWIGLFIGLGFALAAKVGLVEWPKVIEVEKR